MICFENVNLKKTHEVILWITNIYFEKFNIDITTMQILKILYFAEKEHLKKYGRTIVTNYYAAMFDGPVSSCTYDVLKKEVDYYGQDLEFEFSLEYRKYVKAKRKADEDYISLSDIECLKNSFDQYSHLSGDEMSKISHKDKAWSKPYKAGSHQMDFKDLIEDDADLIEYLEENAHSIIF